VSGRVVPFDLPNHKVADVLLPWFVNGTLEKDELAFVEEHLSQCALCQREVEWLRELRAACVEGETAGDASAVFGKLRRQLDERRTSRREVSRMGGSWARAPRWSRWAMAVELAAIVGLAGALLPSADGPPLYRTLGAQNSAAQPKGALVVVFDPTTTEADLRRILRRENARVVDGPTQANAYVLEVAPERRKQTLQALRAEPAVTLVEQLDSGEIR
jgi:anti-sigma-K factor RskA